MERTAILVTALVALGLTAISGFWFIPLLRRLKYGQVIKEVGPTWHKNKEGIPTMGGVMLIVGAVAALTVGYVTLVLEVPQFRAGPENGGQYAAENLRFFIGVGAALAFGAIGFADDLLSVLRHTNLGLRARWKLVLQMAVAALYLFLLHRFGGATTVAEIPFVGGVDVGIWYYPAALIFIVGIVNSVNLTDGLDGLASTVTFFVSTALLIAAVLLGYVASGIIATAVAGVAVGFVFWNFYPAKVIMGDTGSMFLGGAVAVIAFSMDQPLLLLLAGIIYILESASVMLQVSFFKITKKLTGTGRRIFKMSPLHHHFELTGMSEIRIVVLFASITVVGCVAAVFSVAR